MLSFWGFCIILALLALIMTKRASVIVALVAVAALVLFQRLSEGGILVARRRIAAHQGTDYASALAVKQTS